MNYNEKIKLKKNKKLNAEENKIFKFEMKILL